MMEGKKLHIVAFDVPYPANYGGIVDVYHKLKSLHEAGAIITYHCFYYRGHNPPTKELDKYCEKVYYYKRKRNIFNLIFGRRPFIVSSRTSTEFMMACIMKTTPILFEGIQTCYWLQHDDIKDMRQCIVRANNIEHEYYAELAKKEKNPLKKLYLMLEAKRLINFEHNLKGVHSILSVAKMDIPHFEQYAPTYHVPPFFDDTDSGETLTFNEDVSDPFILFQGNLSVKENDYAAIHIVKHIAPLTSSRFIVAGKNPSRNLKKMIALAPNVDLVDTPEHDQMNDLIRKAQIHLLLTFQQTGIKLKLLHALQSGKHVIINSFMDDSGIFAEICHVADYSEDIAHAIDKLISQPFTKAMKEERDVKFNKYFNNKKNADKIMSLVKRSAF